MKKLILFLLLIYNINFLAQSTFVAGASFNVEFPTGSFSDDAETGIGGSILGEYFFNDNYSLLLTISYQNFPGIFSEMAVQGMVLDVSINSIPVVVGGRYYIQDGVFTTLELGSYFFRINIDASDLYNEEKYSTDYESKFGGAIGVGYRFNLSEQSAMEFTGLYQIVEDNLNTVDLRLGILLYLDKL